MKISVLTIFPDFFKSIVESPLVSRAIRKGVLELNIVDIKDFADGCYRNIDDSPYGGGRGMIMRCKPIVSALKAVSDNPSRSVLLSPKGDVFSQSKAREYAESEHIILVCGHYEGVDARVEKHIDEQLSIGDFILSGGEIAATVVIDSVVRLLDGVLRDGSANDESHENGLLEYPQYTRPADFNGDKVPEILLSGDQKKIDEWRLAKSLLITKELRPDIFEKYNISEQEIELMKKYE